MAFMLLLYPVLNSSHHTFFFQKIEQGVTDDQLARLAATLRGNTSIVTLNLAGNLNIFHRISINISDSIVFS